ncbi:MAG: TlpA family protein disulfide reductase [Actinomycetota bacterium]|nr:TlpA family protein disulfide reductase [Actinomycetota bacterium]
MTPEGSRHTERPARWRWAAFSLVSIVALGALLGFGLGRDPRAVPSVLVGKRAPAFVLKDVKTGQEVHLADLRGHVVVLNFWASWCVECVEEHPNLFAAWQRYGDSGVVFLSVLYQDRTDAALQFQRRMGQGWPDLLDPGGRTALDYGVTGPPETFFIGPDGRIAAKQVGPSSYALLASRIRSLLPDSRAA